jgi:hypothetical protein
MEMTGRLIVLLMLVASFPALAQQLPTMTDLEAAYCVKITQTRVATLRDELSQAKASNAAGAREWIARNENELRNAESLLDRLQRYLAPKIPQLDKVTLADAMKRGDDDARDYASRGPAIIEGCKATCKLTNTTYEQREAAIACTANCVEHDPLVARLRSCANGG